MSSVTQKRKAGDTENKEEKKMKAASSEMSLIVYGQDFEAGYRRASYHNRIWDVWSQDAARTLTRMCAELGCYRAQFRMSSDPRIKGQEHLQWLILSARGGSRGAMHNLARLHSLGIHVPVNIDAAIHWYEKAIIAGMGPFTKQRLLHVCPTICSLRSPQTIVNRMMAAAITLRDFPPGLLLVAAEYVVVQ